MEEAARNHVRILVQEVVTAVNLAQTSLDTTSYMAFIPARTRDKCEIELKNGIIKATFIDGASKQIIFSHYLITKTPVVPEQEKVNCKKELISIEKKNGIVGVG